MIIEIGPKNASSHTEIILDIKELKNDVKTIKDGLNKVEVVTGKNCMEIE